MKFRVNYAGGVEERSLKYWADEYSFDSEPPVGDVLFDAVLNKLNLSANDNGRIVQIWGYCPYGEWQDTNHRAPFAKQGELIVIDDLEPGYSYRINSDSDWPVFCNHDSGWVCIGSPNTHGQAVEFMSNCISVVNDEGDLVALWLRPEGSIPGSVPKC